MITSYRRGHAIHCDGNAWRYTDNDDIANYDRPCTRCGRMPTVEGYDACLGHIDEATSACCGHGIEAGFVKPMKEATK